MVEAYKTWHRIHGTFERISRYSLGTRIDELFVTLIEQLLLAKYAKPEQKLPLLQKTSITLDTLKFLLQTAWELKCINHKNFADLSIPLQEVGKMIGGWQKQAEQKTSSL